MSGVLRPLLTRTLHDALPVPCRHLPGNHDIGDNPTAVGAAPSQPATEEDRLRPLEAIAAALLTLGSGRRPISNLVSRIGRRAAPRQD